MSRAQAEGVIKNIIREISQECASKGQSVSETLVPFMVCIERLTCENMATIYLLNFDVIKHVSAAFLNLVFD